MWTGGGSPGLMRRTGGEVTVAGIAFAGSRGISKVELSTDGAKTWQPASLEAALAPLTWRRWSFRWSPSGAGKLKLLMRSTDGSGNTETPVPRDPYPDGATGYDAVDVDVARG